ncbi:MAG: flippase-like domain-containing protein, partial [Anaerolineaceae bacterium]
HVVTAYVLSALLGHLAFAATLAVALVVVWFDGELTRAEVLATAVFLVYFLAQMALFTAGLRSLRALRVVHALPGRASRQFRRLARRHVAEVTEDHTDADELFDAIRLLTHRPRAMLVPAFHALMVEALGVASIAVILVAFGEHGGLPVSLVAYAISVLFSIVGFLPAGIGFAEASLAATLTAFGVPGPVAAVVVLTYRLFEVWVPFVIGGFAAQALARTKASA